MTKRRGRASGRGRPRPDAGHGDGPEEGPEPPPGWFDRRLLLVVGTALAVRLLYLATADGPSFEDPIVDGDYYDYLGARLAAGEGFDPGPFWQPPLYPLLLGGLYAAFGHDLLWPRLLQLLLGTLTAAFAVRIGARLSGRALVGVAAGLLVALHGSLVFYGGELLATTTATFLGALALLLAVDGDGSWRRAAAAGGVAGLGATAAGPLLLLAAPLAWHAARPRRRHAAVLAMAALVPVLATATANRVRAGEWIPISANAGINLWLGNNPDADRTTAVRPGAGWEQLVNEPFRLGIETPGGQDAYFARKAAAYCATTPVSCLGGLLWKTRLLLAARELPRNESLDVVRDQSPVLQVLAARAGPLALPYVLLLPLAAAGVWFAWRAGRRGRLAVWAAAALGAGPVVFFVSGRHRAPLAPLLCVLAAWGTLELWRQRRRAWPAAAAAGLALVPAVWPVQTAADRVDFAAELHYAVGGRRARLGDDEGAVAAWQRAVERRRDYVEAWYNLALAEERLGRLAEARASYDAVLELVPDHGAAAARRAALLDSSTLSTP
ncbi:MAG: tetratricopeptide repeat protein [Deltaproteobacteria bacterium]|nr:tetratricopeptide repeat protein [Deltaproteobacteria bacterium]